MKIPENEIKELASLLRTDEQKSCFFDKMKEIENIDDLKKAKKKIVSILMDIFKKGVFGTTRNDKGSFVKSAKKVQAENTFQQIVSREPQTEDDEYHLVPDLNYGINNIDYFQKGNKGEAFKLTQIILRKLKLAVDGKFYE